MNDELKKIQQILSEKFGATKDSITPEASLSDDLNLSELEIDDLLTIVAHDYNFTLPQDLDHTTLESVGDILLLIEQNSDEL